MQLNEFKIHFLNKKEEIQNGYFHSINPKKINATMNISIKIMVYRFIQFKIDSQ
jgi:hypothetical protein